MGILDNLIASKAGPAAPPASPYDVSPPAGMAPDDVRARLELHSQRESMGVPTGHLLAQLHNEGWTVNEGTPDFTNIDNNAPGKPILSSLIAKRKAETEENRINAPELATFGQLPMTGNELRAIPAATIASAGELAQGIARFIPEGIAKAGSVVKNVAGEAAGAIDPRLKFGSLEQVGPEAEAIENYKRLGISEALLKTPEEKALATGMSLPFQVPRMVGEGMGDTALELGAPPSVAAGISVVPDALMMSAFPGVRKSFKSVVGAPIKAGMEAGAAKLAAKIPKEWLYTETAESKGWTRGQIRDHLSGKADIDGTVDPLLKESLLKMNAEQWKSLLRPPKESKTWTREQLNDWLTNNYGIEVARIVTRDPTWLGKIFGIKAETITETFTDQARPTPRAGPEPAAPGPETPPQAPPEAPPPSEWEAKFAKDSQKTYKSEAAAARKAQNYAENGIEVEVQKTGTGYVLVRKARALPPAGVQPPTEPPQTPPQTRPPDDNDGSGGGGGGVAAPLPAEKPPVGPQEARSPAPPTPTPTQEPIVAQGPVDAELAAQFEATGMDKKGARTAGRYIADLIEAGDVDGVTRVYNGWSPAIRAGLEKWWGRKPEGNSMGYISTLISEKMRGRPAPQKGAPPASTAGSEPVPASPPPAGAPVSTPRKRERPQRSGYPEAQVPDVATAQTDIEAVKSHLEEMRTDYRKKKEADPQSMDTMALGDRIRTYEKSLDLLRTRQEQLQKTPPTEKPPVAPEVAKQDYQAEADAIGATPPIKHVGEMGGRQMFQQEAPGVGSFTKKPEETVAQAHETAKARYEKPAVAPEVAKTVAPPVAEAVRKETPKEKSTKEQKKAEKTGKHLEGMGLKLGEVIEYKMYATSNKMARGVITGVFEMRNGTLVPMVRREGKPPTHQEDPVIYGWKKPKAPPTGVAPEVAKEPPKTKPSEHSILGQLKGRIKIPKEEWNARKIFENGLAPFFTTKATGMQYDKKIQELVELGILQEGADLQTFIDQLQREQAARKRGEPVGPPTGDQTEAAGQEYLRKEEEKYDLQPVNTAALEVGDIFKIRDEEYEVVEERENGDLMIQDGEMLTLAADSEVYVNGGMDGVKKADDQAAQNKREEELYMKNVRTTRAYKAVQTRLAERGYVWRDEIPGLPQMKDVKRPAIDGIFKTLEAEGYKVTANEVVHDPDTEAPPKGDMRAHDVKPEEYDIEKGKDGKWYIFADDTEIAGPFPNEADAKSWKQYHVVRHPDSLKNTGPRETPSQRLAGAIEDLIDEKMGKSKPAERFKAQKMPGWKGYWTVTDTTTGKHTAPTMEPREAEANAALWNKEGKIVEPPGATAPVKPAEEAPKGDPFKLDTQEAPAAETPLIPEMAGEQSELFPGQRAKYREAPKAAPAPPPEGGLFGKKAEVPTEEAWWLKLYDAAKAEAVPGTKIYTWNRGSNPLAVVKSGPHTDKPQYWIMEFKPKGKKGVQAEPWFKHKSSSGDPEKLATILANTSYIYDGDAHAAEIRGKQPAEKTSKEAAPPEEAAPEQDTLEKANEILPQVLVNLLDDAGTEEFTDDWLHDRVEGWVGEGKENPEDGTLPEWVTPVSRQIVDIMKTRGYVAAVRKASLAGTFYKITRKGEDAILKLTEPKGGDDGPPPGAYQKNLGMMEALRNNSGRALPNVPTEKQFNEAWKKKDPTQGASDVFRDVAQKINPPDDSTLYSGFPLFDKEVWKKAFPNGLDDIIKDLAERRKLAKGAIRDDLGWFNATVNTPYYVFVDTHPEGKPVFDRARKAFQEREDITSELSELIEPYAKLTQADQKPINKALIRGRYRRKVYTNDELRDRHHLNDDQIAAYRGVRAAMERALSLFENAIVHRLTAGRITNASELSMDMLADLLDQLYNPADAPLQGEMFGPSDRLTNEKIKFILETIDKIRSAKRTGYIPFTRFGDFAFGMKKVVNGQPGPYTYWATAESGWKAGGEFQKAKKRFASGIEAGRIVPVEPRQMAKNAKRDLIQGVGAFEVGVILQMAGLDVGTNEAFKELIDKLIQEQGFKSHFLTSNDLPGFSTDIERSLADYVIGISGYIARMKAVPEMDKAALPAFKSKPKLAKYYDDWKKYIFSPQEEYQRLRSGLFVFYLGGNIKSMLVNLTQPIVASGPWLTQYVSEARAAAAIGKAFADVTKAIGTKEDGGFGLNIEKLPDDVREHVRRAIREGIISETLVYELMATARKPPVLRKMSKHKQRASYYMGMLFSRAEKVNRMVTMIAALRTHDVIRQQREAAAAGGGAVPPRFGGGGAGAAFEDDPFEFGKRAVDETQFIYSKLNRPKMFRKIGALLGVFRSFAINFIEHLARLWRVSRRAVLNNLAMLSAFAGILGLPLANDLKNLMEGIYQVFSHRVPDAETAMREWGKEVFGDAKWVDVLLHGPARTLGGDISRSVGQGDVVPGLGGKGNLLQEIVGVPADIVVRVNRAYQQAMAGNYGRAGEALAPEFIRNPMVAARWAKEGVLNSGGQPLVSKDRITALDILLKTIGVQPTKVSIAYEREEARDKLRKRLDQAERDLTKKILNAYRKGDETEAGRLLLTADGIQTGQTTDDGGPEIIPIPHGAAKKYEDMVIVSLPGIARARQEERLGDKMTGILKQPYMNRPAFLKLNDLYQ